MKVRALLMSLFGLAATGASPGSESPQSPTPEQAIVVHFQYGSTDLSRLFALEHQLEAAIAAAKAGVYDGNEVATDGSDGFLYMYGPDADGLFAVIKPVLEKALIMRGTDVKLRYGRPGVGAKEGLFRIAP